MENSLESIHTEFDKIFSKISPQTGDKTEIPSDDDSINGLFDDIRGTIGYLESSARNIASGGYEDASKLLLEAKESTMCESCRSVIDRARADLDYASRICGLEEEDCKESAMKAKDRVDDIASMLREELGKMEEEFKDA